MDEYTGQPIGTDEAWGMLARWRSEHREIGVIFWSGTANLYATGVVESATSVRLRIKGHGALASFQLSGAAFRYGPMQTWPRWPSPPVVSVNALRAEFANGDYLALAEGLTPEGVPGRMISD